MPASRALTLRPTAIRTAVALLGCSMTAAVGLSATPASGATPPAPTSLTVVHHGPGSYLKWQESVWAGTFVIKQATNGTLTRNVHTYRMRGPGHVFTPFGLTAGTTYYYRVRAIVHGVESRWSNRASFTWTHQTSNVRVLSYNVMSATFDGEKHAGGIAAPFSDRRTPQLNLMLNSGADVIGIQEGSACLVKYYTKPCYRQVDSLADGLSPTYKLDNTYSTSKGVNLYLGNYILYKNTVRPVGSGGTWYLGPSNNQRKAAYQAFQIVSSGAKFLFVNAHLITGDSLTYDKIRGTETTNMVKDARNYASNHGISSVVFVGDFNSYVGEWHVDDISGKNMRSMGIPEGIAVAQKRSKAYYDSINALYRTPRRGHGSIDHVYATGGVGVRLWGERLHLASDGDFAGTIPSDHNPVVSVLAIPF